MNPELLDPVAETRPMDAELAARLERLANRQQPATSSDSRRRRKKRHPAKRSRAAALGLSLVVTGCLAAAFALEASSMIQPAGGVQLADGAAAMTVDGAVFKNKWGPVQVQAVFASDGALTDVVVLQSPYADGESVRINDRAIPLLNSEALGSQSASVDTVSGATYTTKDYEKSLQSAIDAARIAEVTALV